MIETQDRRAIASSSGCARESRSGESGDEVPDNIAFVWQRGSAADAIGQASHVAQLSLADLRGCRAPARAQGRAWSARRGRPSRALCLHAKSAYFAACLANLPEAAGRPHSRHRQGCRRLVRYEERCLTPRMCSCSMPPANLGAQCAGFQSAAKASSPMTMAGTFLRRRSRASICDGRFLALKVDFTVNVRLAISLGPLAVPAQQSSAASPASIGLPTSKPASRVCLLTR